MNKQVNIDVGDWALPDHQAWRLLSQSSMQRLLSHASTRVWERGNSIDVEVALVCSGVCAIERKTSDGRRALCALYRSGDLIDIRGSDQGHRGHLVALRPVTLLSITQRAFDRCLAEDTGLAEAAHGQMREMMVRMRDHAMDLACKTPSERLASLLLEFRRWPDCLDRYNGTECIHLPVKRMDIGDYIGIRPETLSRTFKALSVDGLIDLVASDRVTLADLPALRRLANGGRPRRSTRAA